MADMTLADINGFYAWASMLVNNNESYFVPEANLQIDFFGYGDSAYLVIDLYTTPSSCRHYEFAIAEEINQQSATSKIFDLLKAMDFSLEKIIEWLENATFEDSEMGERISIHGLHVYRSNLQQNK
jgi:hypothetical protein